MGFARATPFPVSERGSIPIRLTSLNEAGNVPPSPSTRKTAGSSGGSRPTEDPPDARTQRQAARRYASFAISSSVVTVRQLRAVDWTPRL
jgi:hypothetical protein